MDALSIEGGYPLQGSIRTAGAKNAALPLMAASILNENKICLSDVPYLSDIKTMQELLNNLGAEITDEGDNYFCITNKKIKSHIAPYEIVKKMRASAIIMGGLLAREGRAELSLPGGCAIGARPINFHLEAFKQMGAEIELEAGYVIATAKNGLKGTIITFPQVSVGATENVLIASVLAEGETIIRNAAIEPEIDDLAKMLNKMGAKISGIGTRELEIKGVTSLKPSSYTVIPDRIEAASYMIAAAMTEGEIKVENINPDILRSTLDILKKIGVGIKTDSKNKTITAYRKSKFKPNDVVTEVYPGFPTDMQAQITALLCLADGKSHMVETIFENRFMHIPELRRMGGNIDISGNRLTIKGIEKFQPAEVMATDLRASVSLVLAALNADGKSKIDRVYHLDRGYENIEQKLNKCGAKIRRIKESP